jgi:hypothetical protein
MSYSLQFRHHEDLDEWWTISIHRDRDVALRIQETNNEKTGWRKYRVISGGKAETMQKKVKS